MNNDDYPKSSKGFKCLGPCYKPNTWVLHPIILKLWTNKESPFCPTKRWIDRNPSSQKEDVMYFDKCFKSTYDNEDRSIQMNIVFPKFGFGCEEFLKMYYNIYSFENGIDWLENNYHTSYYTKIRILECMWAIFGNNKEIINERLMLLYRELIKKYWTNELYNKFKKYVIIDNNEKIYFGKDNMKKILNNDNKKIATVNFLIKKLLTNNNIYKVLNAHIEEYSQNWNNISSHVEHIQHSFFEHLENIIINIFNKDNLI
jgi:hypothetical protein